MHVCSGFGECTARHLAAKGAKVVLTARSVPAMEKIVEEIKEAGGEAACCKLDLTKDEDHVAAFAFAKETYGPVEFLFCNGGTAGVEVNGMKPLHEMTPDEMRITTDANYFAVLLGFRYAYDHFKEAGGGAIVINASYTASMSTAVLALFKSPGGGGSGGICAFDSPPSDPPLISALAARRHVDQGGGDRPGEEHRRHVRRSEHPRVLSQPRVLPD